MDSKVELDLKLFDGFYSEYFAKDEASVENLPEFAKSIYWKLVKLQESVVESKKWTLLSSILTEEERKYTCCEWMNLNYEIKFTSFELKLIIHCAVSKNDLYLLDFMDKNGVTTDNVHNTTAREIIYKAAIYYNNIELIKKYEFSGEKTGPSYKSLYKHSILNSHSDALNYLLEYVPIPDNSIEKDMFILLTVTENIDMIKSYFGKIKDDPYMKYAACYYLIINLGNKIVEIIPDWFTESRKYMIRAINYVMNCELPSNKLIKVLDYSDEKKMILDISQISYKFNHKLDIKLLQDKVCILLNRMQVVMPDIALRKLIEKFYIDIDIFSLFVNHNNFDMNRFLSQPHDNNIKFHIKSEMIDILIDKGINTKHFHFVELFIDDLSLVKYTVDKYHEKLNMEIIFTFICKNNQLEYAKYLYERFCFKDTIISRVYYIILRGDIRHIDILEWINELIHKKKLYAVV
jgi:hypothetical protein